MSVNLSPIGNGYPFFTNTGLPLAGGLIYTYQAGSSTPLTTYTTSGGSIANTNPIVLGTSGLAPQEIWLTAGSAYKFVVTDSNNNVLQTLDNISGILSSAPATSQIPSGCIIIWSGAITSLPSGYVLCNGSNGTPDLRDKFVVGAGNSYVVGATSDTTGTGSNLPAYYALAYIQKT
jgi:hypothetical protein